MVSRPRTKKQNPGSSKRVFGKSEAREQFLPLVDAVTRGAGPFEITDRGKVVALLLSKQEYDWLLGQAKDKPEPRRSLRGSIIVLGDIEQGSKEIAAAFESSLENTAREL